MKTVVKKLYEAMFLVDSAQAAADWDGSLAFIKNILERAEAEIVSIRKWDERKLAYKIEGKSRGTYILCYFRVDGEKVRDIERDVRLSERIMRVLILSAEHMMQADIERDTPATRAEKYRQKGAQEASDKIDKEHISDDNRKQVSSLEGSQTQNSEVEQAKGLEQSTPDLKQDPALREQDHICKTSQVGPEPKRVRLGTLPSSAADAGESKPSEQGQTKDFEYDDKQGRKEADAEMGL